MHVGQVDLAVSVVAVLCGQRAVLRVDTHNTALGAAVPIWDKRRQQDGRTGHGGEDVVVDQALHAVSGVGRVDAPDQPTIAMLLNTLSLIG